MFYALPGLTFICRTVNVKYISLAKEFEVPVLKNVSIKVVLEITYVKFPHINRGYGESTDSSEQNIFPPISNLFSF